MSIISDVNYAPRGSANADYVE
jgi:hypothetical protein